MINTYITVAKTNIGPIFVLGILLRPLYLSTNLMFITTLYHWYDHQPHFTDEENEVKIAEVNYSRSHTNTRLSQNLNLTSLALVFILSAILF